MVYLDFDGLLYNSVQRSIDLWDLEGWSSPGLTYDGYGDYYHYRSLGYPTFYPMQWSPSAFYSLAGDKLFKYVYPEVLTGALTNQDKITVLSVCATSAAAEAKRDWMRSVGLNCRFLAVPKPSAKQLVYRPGDVLIDDYQQNAYDWAKLGGTVLVPDRPWTKWVGGSERIRSASDQEIANALANGV